MKDSFLTRSHEDHEEGQMVSDEKMHGSFLRAFVPSCDIFGSVMP